MPMGNLGSGGARLGMLLRRFGLCPVELARQEPKVAVSVLKAAYYSKAKEAHPDYAPEEDKDAAAQRFVELNSEFAEAVKMLEAGVVPASWASGSSSSSSSSPSGVGGGGAHNWQAGYRPGFHSAPWPGGGKPFQHSEPPQFDLYTRAKGHLIVWSSLFVFLTLFREFLVGTAGSTWSWSPPNTINPFWVRRFKDEWGSEAQVKQISQDAQVPKPPKPEKVYRDTPTFYQKRGISNVRRKYEPRGFGPSL
ncbi:unnamed protein product [Polarella glacialis]|uniref:J domain-containing protein n=1 Tax=Polarella glacialis TaxID=89957 RepID=A0A813GMX7_POLGL|nr:unnamed protein product [Polarella glacialis]